MDSRTAGWVLVALGGVAVVIGLLVISGALSWFGRLPGDVRYEGPRTRVYVPVTSMILVSVVLTLALWLASALRR